MAMKFKPSTSAESSFAKALRKVARYSGHIVDMHVDGDTIKDPAAMEIVLNQYSRRLEPWARRQAAKMLTQVSNTNKRTYTSNSKEIGLLLKLKVAEKEVGAVARALMHEQVALIQSIPKRAAERAQKLAMEAALNGTRASEVAKELQRTTQVSESDAVRIARTEVARSNSSLTQARAQAVGSQSYIWRTTMDGAERKSHREMNGKTILWSRIPTLSDGTQGHAGTLINCRCYPDPQFDNETLE